MRYQDVEEEISASADGGPRSQVCARETLRLAPHRHDLGAHATYDNSFL